MRKENGMGKSKAAISTIEVGLTHREMRCFLMQIASDFLDADIVCNEYSMSYTPEVPMNKQPRRIAVTAKTGKLSINLEVEYRL